ncbi:MAG: filamentous hemagglutinin N-terminal domain-containing protein [Geminicoccaceae bacterium]|nr:filamentous hemagglutinin N-terminal domain-containing protein [Geminicoccaceae bacterium]
MLLGAAPVALAQVTTDGSMGPVVTLDGPEVEIGAGLGRQRGANLFHSFAKFDVAPGQTTSFTGPDSVRHVLARVTGGDPSTIRGLLTSTMPQADLWLANPAGITVSDGGVVDVPGGLHLSTAGEIRMADGSRFATGSAAPPVLSVAAPESFGFLGGDPASVTLDRAELRVGAGGTLEIAAGDIALTDSTAGLRAKTIRLRAAGGDLTLASSGVGEEPAANVAVEASRLIMTDSRIDAGSIDEAGMRFALGELLMAASRIGGAAVEGATAGILVEADRIAIGGDGGVLTLTEGDAAGASIRVAARAMDIRAGGRIGSIASGGGDAGPVDVDVGALAMSERGELGSLSSGSGRAGAVRIDAGTIDMATSALIASVTSGSGAAGSVAITADRIDITGEAIDKPTGVTAQAAPGSTGPAGTISIETGSLSLRNGGRVESLTFGPGAAGTISVDAKRIEIVGVGDSNESVTSITTRTAPQSSGSGGAIFVVADEIALSEGGEIESSTTGTGDAGAVLIDAGSLRLERGAFVGTATLGPGAAGGVLVRAGTILVDRGDTGRPTVISAESVPGASGDAGDVLIQARRITLKRAGSIESTSSGTGNAGGVAIAATEELRLESLGTVSSTALQSGTAGDVVLGGKRIVADQGAIITAGLGNTGGRIVMGADRSIYLARTLVTSSAVNVGEATSVIVLQAPAIALNRSAVLSTLEGSNPRPGGIPADSAAAVLLADVAVVSTDSVVLGTNTTFIGGLDSEIGNDLQAPDVVLGPTDTLIADRCSVTGAEDRSTFRQIGRGGLPPSPDTPLASASRGAPAERSASVAARTADCPKG